MLKPGEVDVQAAGGEYTRRGEDMESVEGQGNAKGDDEGDEDKDPEIDNDMVVDNENAAKDQLVRSRKYAITTGKIIHDASM